MMHFKCHLMLSNSKHINIPVLLKTAPCYFQHFQGPTSTSLKWRNLNTFKNFPQGINTLHRWQHCTTSAVVMAILCKRNRLIVKWNKFTGKTPQSTTIKCEIYKLGILTLDIRTVLGMLTYFKWNLFSFWRQQHVPRSFIVYLDITTTCIQSRL